MAIVICDIDGVIIDSDVRPGEKDYFSKARENFSVIEGGVKLAKQLKGVESGQIIFLTGRSEAVRDVTEYQLEKAGMIVGADNLIMTPANFNGSIQKFKARKVAEIVQSHSDIFSDDVFFIDDNYGTLAGASRINGVICVSFVKPRKGSVGFVI